MISTNIEFSWDLNESILSWEFLGWEINYTFIFDALIWENMADTVCSIVDAICGRESWSQRIWNLAEILNQSILYLQYLGREINYELIFHVVKVRPTLLVQLWMQYAAEDHNLNEFGIQPRFCISQYFIYNTSAEKSIMNSYFMWWKCDQHCLFNCGCNMRLRIIISMNLESGRDSESVNTLFTIPQPRNQLWTHISCGKSAADTVCSIVDAICSRGS